MYYGIYGTIYVLKKNEQMMHGWGIPLEWAILGIATIISLHFPKHTITPQATWPLVTWTPPRNIPCKILKGCYSCWLLAFVIFFSSLLFSPTSLQKKKKAPNPLFSCAISLVTMDSCTSKGYT